MDAAGVDVRVALRDDHHVIRLRDVAGMRTLEIPVTRSFDAEVTTFCCSLALCGELPECGERGARLAREWPELARLAWACQTTASTADPSA